MRADRQLLDMHLSPLHGPAELVSARLALVPSVLPCFASLPAVVQICRSRQTRALPKGVAQLWLLVDSSQLIEASLMACLVVL